MLLKITPVRPASILKSELWKQLFRCQMFFCHSAASWQHPSTKTAAGVLAWSDRNAGNMECL